MIKVGLITLGCAKNKVDSEIILGMLNKADFTYCPNVKDADVVILNTCAFILDSTRESIDAIIELEELKKPIFVVGCLVERYKQDLIRNFLNSDITFISISDYPKINEIIGNHHSIRKEIPPFNPLSRSLAPSSFHAYLRISEGCSNRCTFCAIPLIRGPFRSRKKEEILEEAKILKEKGIKEITIISQDTSHYGYDLYKDYRLKDLLVDLLPFDFFSIRLLYLYPDAVDLSFIEVIKEHQDKIVPYFDLPLQHASKRVLYSMNRRGDERKYQELIETIRKEIPQAIIRSTFIVGYPGEKKEDFEELLSFIERMKIDHVGAFMYSREKGTPAYELPHQVAKSTKKNRYSKLMETQQDVVGEENAKHIDEVMKGIVIGYDKPSLSYLVRTYFNAPDDIDGRIYLKTDKKHLNGDIVTLKVHDYYYYDLFAHEVDED